MEQNIFFIETKKKQLIKLTFKMTVVSLTSRQILFISLMFELRPRVLWLGLLLWCCCSSPLRVQSDPRRTRTELQPDVRQTLDGNGIEEEGVSWRKVWEGEGGLLQPDRRQHVLDLFWFYLNILFVLLLFIWWKETEILNWIDNWSVLTPSVSYFGH